MHVKTAAFTLLVTCFAALAEQNLRKIDVYQGGGLLPHVVDSNEWRTTLYFHNMDSVPVYTAVSFQDDSGKPMRLPIAGMDVRSLAFTIQPGNTKVFETTGTGSLKQGYADVWTCDRACSDSSAKPVDAKLAAFAVFRQRVAGRADSEAVVPLEMPERDAHIVFDNRNNYATGIALLNFMGGNIEVTIRDEDGQQLSSETLRLAEDGKVVFVLAEKYPVTVGKYGCIEFSGAGLAAMGLRFNPSGSFTSSHAITIH